MKSRYSFVDTAISDGERGVFIIRNEGAPKWIPARLAHTAPELLTIAKATQELFTLMAPVFHNIDGITETDYGKKFEEMAATISRAVAKAEDRDGNESLRNLFKAMHRPAMPGLLRTRYGLG